MNDKFTEEQLKHLKSPLDQTNVAMRAGAGGKQLSYIEGWHAMAEANRIFGYDAWSRETITCEEEHSAKVDGKWEVCYQARVRVHVNGVFRDGTGHGIKKMTSLPGAIEFAAKEAETDATKRALATFGNQFGLCLYDDGNLDIVQEPEVGKTLDDVAKIADKMVISVYADDYDWLGQWEDKVGKCKSISHLISLETANKEKLNWLEVNSPDIHEQALVMQGEKGNEFS